jgi:hypothetical protein
VGNQWPNVISTGPRFKIFEGSSSRSAKGTSRAPYMHEFSRGPGHAHARENFWIYSLWNAISWTLGRDFTEFWWSENDIVTYQRSRWPMFLFYSLSHWGWGPRVRPVRTHSSYATVGNTGTLHPASSAVNQIARFIRTNACHIIIKFICLFAWTDFAESATRHFLCFCICAWS